MGRVRILDATIRDGGYIIHHHFSKADVGLVVGALDTAGIPYIEVGHGMGIGCHLWDESTRPKSLPFIREEDHAQAAVAAARRASLGVLFVAGPSFAPLEYIDRVAELGFHFVRIAVMPGVPNDRILPYVKRAKGHGLTTGLNLMQTYSRSPGAVAEVARAAAAEGADWFFIVDSAGGMRADEIKRYVGTILGRADLEVGLHSHNNMGGAVANGMAAVEAGATLVDGSMNGIGRSTGNAPTEQLAIALRNRLGHHVDLDALIGLGRAVRSLFDDAGNDPFDVVSGGAKIHSRNVPRTLEFASKRGLAPSEFLIEVGREGREQDILAEFVFPDEVYEAAAERTSAIRALEPGDSVVDIVADDILNRWRGGAGRAIEDLLLRKQQHHKPSVLHLSRAARNVCRAPVHWEQKFVGVTIPWNGEALDIADSRRPDVLLLDQEDDGDPPVQAIRHTWRISFTDVEARATLDLALSLRNRGHALWAAESVDAARVASLEALGVKQGGQRPDGPVALVSTRSPQPEEEFLQQGDCVVLASGAPPERVGSLRSRGVRVLAADWKVAVAHVVDALDRLERALEDGAETAQLAASPFARGPGQALWDPETATIVDADEGEAAEPARRAAAEASRSLWTGVRRF